MAAVAVRKETGKRAGPQICRMGKNWRRRNFKEFVPGPHPIRREKRVW
jgi:hypothetical protein